MNTQNLNLNLAAPWRVESGVYKAPISLMHIGVACGNMGCLKYTENVLRKYAPLFEGTPVIINHPVDAYDRAISISEVDKSRIIGFISKPYFDRDALRATVNITSTDPALKWQIQDMKEVSIGVRSQQTDVPGEFLGKRYIGEVTGLSPDHVAILSGNAKGACSVQDGCGIRNSALTINICTNQDDGIPKLVPPWVSDTPKKDDPRQSDKLLPKSIYDEFDKKKEGK